MWHKKHRSGFVFPIHRDEAWEYLNFLENEKAGATAGASFLQAVRFAQYVLGFRDVESLFASKYLSGRADQMLSRKEPWAPADLLTGNDVLLLHDFVADSRNGIIDRTAAVHFLHALYSRSRWSDFRHVEEIILDYDEDFNGYLEVTTRWHKTARNADVKAKLLPVVAPCIGLAEESWVKYWVELRTAVGLLVKGGIKSLLLPASDLHEVGRWTVRPIEAREATKWLRDVLECLRPGYRACGSSHSLKSTPLLWCAKLGIPEKDQDTLGRHVTLGSKHVMCMQGSSLPHP